MNVLELAGELDKAADKLTDEVVIACEHDHGTNKFSHALVYVTGFKFGGKNYVKLVSSYRQLDEQNER